MAGLGVGEAVLHLAGVDQLPPPALAEIDAVELSTPFGDAGDEERIAMPASHVEPVTVAPTDEGGEDGLNKRSTGYSSAPNGPCQ
jgi:hypothetical protein